LEYFWSFQLINYSYKDFARATNWSINNKDSQEKGFIIEEEVFAEGFSEINFAHPLPVESFQNWSITYNSQLLLT